MFLSNVFQNQFSCFSFLWFVVTQADVSQAVTDEAAAGKGPAERLRPPSGSVCQTEQPPSIAQLGDQSERFHRAGGARIYEAILEFHLTDC